MRLTYVKPTRIKINKVVDRLAAKSLDGMVRVQTSRGQWKIVKDNS